MNNLHVHSDFSKFDGFQTIPELVARVKELNQSAVAITEHGNLSSMIPFYKECKKNGIKPIIGCEFYFVPDCGIKERSDITHLILLAMNNTGLYNLKKLDQLAYENMYYKPRIDENMLSQYSDGLICTSACMGSILNRKTENNNFDFSHAEFWINKFKTIFGDRFYLEIQSNTMPEQKSYNESIFSLSVDLNIPCIVTTDAHYSTKDMSEFHRLWVNIQKADNDYYPVDDFYLQDTETIRGIIDYLPSDFIESCMSNTDVIADKCNVTLEIEGNHYPVFPCDNPLEEVKKICRVAWREKILPMPKPEQEKYLQRFLYELGVLERCNYLNYLLIVRDILDYAKQENILTGIGRGSVGGSLVCYLMGLTKLDPIPHKLEFWRFVNEQRVSAADVDSDLATSGRDKIIQYVKDKYGYVYNVRTFGILGTKGAIQRAGQALKMEPQEYMSISKNCLDLSQLPKNRLREVAEKFEGRLFSFGSHASAVMIFPDDPLIYAPIEKQDDIFVASADYHDLEEFHLLKLDLLGLKNLDVIQWTIEGKDINIENLPFEQEVFNQYSNGHTVGIFQVESPIMTKYAKSLKVDRFEDIVALIALVRPGPISRGMIDSYVENKLSGNVTFLHPDLEEILGTTFGTLVYQEQLCNIAMKLGGYSLGEADVLRKVVGRKELDHIQAATDEFIERAIKNGISESVATELGRQIYACGRYIFGLAHATLYAYTSYITAYLKYHYPVDYMCSLLNNEITDQEKSLQYIYEAKRMGIPIIPPDLNNSLWTVQNNSLKIGYSYVKNVSKELTTTIPAEMNKRQAESLIKAGCFGENYNQLLSDLEYDKTVSKKMNDILAKLDTELSDKKRVEWECKLNSLPDRQMNIETTDADRMKYQIEVLGFSFYEKEVGQRYQVDSLIPQIVSGELIEFKPRKDKKNKPMAFLKVRTPFGIVDNLVMFHRNYCELIEGQQYQMVVEKNIIKEVR